MTLPGGELRIEWRESDDHVLMTGPVEFEREGRFDLLATEMASNMELLRQIRESIATDGAAWKPVV